MNKHKEKRSYKNCCSAGCTNTTYNCDLTFFSLPSDVERRSIWLRLLLREDLEDTNSFHYRVCEKHFDSDSILITPNRKLLKRHAVPCRVLPRLEGEEAPQPPPDRSDQPTTHLGTNRKTVPQAPLRQFTRDANNPTKKYINIAPTPKSIFLLGVPDYKKLESFFELCDRFLSKKLAKIVKEQAKINLYDFRNTYSIGYKVFCLNLYHVSPEAYNLLSDTLCLPTRTMLVRMCEPVLTQPNHIMEMLKIKAALMTDREKHCCVFIDAIKLKTNYAYCPKEDKIYGFHHEDQVRQSGPAEYGLVAFVQGIFGEYRQPAGYTMLAADADSARVAEWTDQLLNQLCAAGLNVRVLIPGSSYPFLNSANTRQVSVTYPYFFVNNRKIYYMFDPAQLILETRDSLMMYDFHFNSSVAKWEDIRQFYEKDSAMQLRLAPKLTQDHMDSSGSGKCQARLAAQAFSAPVAAGMATYLSLGLLDTSAEGTINLITKINDLVHFFNLSSIYDCPSYRNDFSDQVHKAYFINSMLSFFSTLQVIGENNGIDVTSLVTFVESSQITLKSILHLYIDLEMNGFTYELTRQLNRDYIDNFIDDVKKAYENEELTSWLLVTEFRNSNLAVLLQPRKQEKDMGGLFDATPRRNHTSAGVSKASTKNKKRASVVPLTANQQQHVSDLGTAEDIQTTYIKQESEMEVDNDRITQIKKEQEEFLNMDITIEEHEVTISSKKQERNKDLSHIKLEDDSLEIYSFLKQKDKDEKINTTQQIKQEQEDLLLSSFDMEGDEIVITSMEQEHNYGSTIIKQEPDNITGDTTSLINDNIVHNIAKGSTSKDESSNSSPHSNNPDEQDTSTDDSEAEITVNSFLKPSTLESDDIFNMVFTMHDSNNKKRDTYQKCKEPIRTADYTTLNLPKKNALVYISGWLLQKCHYYHKSCDDFNAYIQIDLTQTQYSRYIDYCKSGGTDLHFIPRDSFIKYVELLDGIFGDIFKAPRIHFYSILGCLLKAETKVSYCYEMPCSCFPIDYARQLFFRIRLHYTLEYNNEHMNKTFIVPIL